MVGTGFRLEDGILDRVVERMRKHVDLVWVGKVKLPDLAGVVEDDGKQAYMQPVRFAGPVQVEVDSFPAEGVGWGSLQITSQSAHIYESEWEEAKQVAKCEVWKREPREMFDPAEEGDARGVVMISLIDNGYITG